MPKQQILIKKLVIAEASQPLRILLVTLNLVKNVGKIINHYIKKTSKNKINKKKLEVENKKLEKQETQDPTSKTTYIIVGIGGGAVLITIIALLVRKSKKKKTIL